MVPELVPEAVHRGVAKSDRRAFGQKAGRSPTQSERPLEYRSRPRWASAPGGFGDGLDGRARRRGRPTGDVEATALVLAP